MLKYKYYALIVLIALLFMGSKVAYANYSGTMSSVLKIFGSDAEKNSIIATSFAISNFKNNERYIILFTATHVLERISGDYAQIQLKKKTNKSDTLFNHRFLIRKDGKNLYLKHDDFDLSAIKVLIPHEVDMTTFSETAIADSDVIRKISASLAHEVLIIGFPFGESCNEQGFAFIKKGIISSYPFEGDSFAIDFAILEGFSGAPVISKEQNRIIGVISEEIIFEKLTKDSQNLSYYKANMGKAIPSSAIKQLMSKIKQQSPD